MNLTTDVVNKYVSSQALRTFSEFKSTYLLKTKEIFDRNITDPVGYANEYDSFVDGVLKKLPDEDSKAQLLSFCGDDKQRGILAITKNKTKEDTKATIKSIREGGEYIVSQLPVTLATGYSESDRESINDSLLVNFRRAISGYNARISGQRLMNDSDIRSFAEQYNQAVEHNIVESLLNNCQDVGQVDSLLFQLNDGGITAPVFGIEERDGDVVGTITDNRKIDLSDDNIRSLIADRRKDLMTQSITGEQVSRLSSENCMHIGVTQQSADQYFDKFSEVFKSGILPEQLNCAKNIAQKMDIVPSMVIRTIEQSITGDPTVCQLASIFLRAWEVGNPRALADAFQDNPEILARAFQQSANLGIVQESTSKSISLSTMPYGMMSK